MGASTSPCAQNGARFGPINSTPCFVLETGVSPQSIGFPAYVLPLAISIDTPPIGLSRFVKNLKYPLFSGSGNPGVTSNVPLRNEAYCWINNLSNAVALPPILIFTPFICSARKSPPSPPSFFGRGSSFGSCPNIKDVAV